MTNQSTQKTTIAINDFVTRQTAESKYSYFDGSWDELVELVLQYFDGNTDEEVVVVTVPPERFFSGVAKLGEDSVLRAQFGARREGEQSYTQVSVVGGMKLPAVSVKIIIYSHETLAKDGENFTDADWEIVSINASATETGEPPTPVAMARNFLGLAGGTKREYTAEQFAEAILFWTQHAMIE